MKFILVRHVETIANSQKKFYGWTESEYSEKGKEQIKEIIKILKYEVIDFIYSSPLKRALHIGELLSRELNKELQIIDNLKEMNFGIFEDKTYKEVIKEYENEWNMWTNDYKNYEIPGGENLKSVHKRATEFIDQIKNKSGKTLIVTHGGIVHSIITHLLNLDIDDRWHFKVLPGTIVEIDYVDKYGIITKLIPILQNL